MSATIHLESSRHEDVPPLPVTNPRKRRWHRKVSSGCPTCRKRRVKCGEERPHCLRCVKLGVTCPGYAKRKGLFIGADGELIQDAFDTLGLRTLSTSPIKDSGGARAFQFYFEVSEPAVSTFFSTQISPLSHDIRMTRDLIKAVEVFWKISFPRLVCMVPAIQSCMLVMTTAHEHVKAARYAMSTDPASLRRYGDAICSLSSGFGSLSVDCILLGSLLLAMGELAYDPTGRGNTHLYSAYEIIQQRSQKPRIYSAYAQKEEIVGLKEVVSIMYRSWFRKMTRAGYLNNKELPDQNAKVHKQNNASRSPFSTLQEAIGVLEEIKFSARQLGNANDVEISEKEGIQLSTESWTATFKDFMKNSRYRQVRGFACACTVVRIHGLILQILASLPNKETDFDEQQSTFMGLADAAEELLRTMNEGFAQTLGEQLVYGFGPVNPLFFAATKCRDREIRQRLLLALRNLKIAEGSWTSCTAYWLARHISDVEEKNSAGSGQYAGGGARRLKLISARLELATTMIVECSVESDVSHSRCVESISIPHCKHQAQLPSIVGSIDEFGTPEGYVAYSTCDCL